MNTVCTGTNLKNWVAGEKEKQNHCNEMEKIYKNENKSKMNTMKTKVKCLVHERKYIDLRTIVISICMYYHKENSN